MMYDNAIEQAKSTEKKQQEAFCLAEVAALFPDHCAKVRFYGEETASEKKYSYLYSYKSPEAGDIVLMGRNGNSWVILGKCVYNEAPGEEGGGSSGGGTEYAPLDHTHDKIVHPNYPDMYFNITKYINSNAIAWKRSVTADLGVSSGKWRNIYATNGTIQTSDKNEKNSIENIPEAYGTLLRNLKPKRYKMNDGTSGRYHTGFIAQDVEEAMKEAGISDLELAAFIKSPAEEETKEGIKQCPEKGFLYGLRYEEFIALNTMMIQDLINRVEELERRCTDDNH